jgi:hypothetical protein
MGSPGSMFIRKVWVFGQKIIWYIVFETLFLTVLWFEKKYFI